MSRIYGCRWKAGISIQALWGEHETCRGSKWTFLELWREMEALRQEYLMNRDNYIISLTSDSSCRITVGREEDEAVDCCVYGDWL